MAFLLLLSDIRRSKTCFFQNPPRAGMKCYAINCNQSSKCDKFSKWSLKRSLGMINNYHRQLMSSWQPGSNGADACLLLRCQLSRTEKPLLRHFLLSSCQPASPLGTDTSEFSVSVSGTRTPEPWWTQRMWQHWCFLTRTWRSWGKVKRGVKKVLIISNSCRMINQSIKIKTCLII